MAITAALPSDAETEPNDPVKKEHIRGLRDAVLELDTRTAPQKRVISGATHTVVLDDAGYVLHTTGTAATTITLPDDTTAISDETVFAWRQFNTGQITFVAGTNAVLLSRGSVFKSAGQYAEGVVTKVGANTWLLSGDIVA